MPPFVITRDCDMPPPEAWARVTDWPRHGRFVPLTTVDVRTAGPNAVGTVFSAHTGVGRVGFDDPMEVVEWEPPAQGRGGRCRLEKRGRVLTGWAELSVEPHGDGSRVVWREQAKAARLPGFTDRLSAACGRLLFTRVLTGLLAA